MRLKQQQQHQRLKWALGNSKIVDYDLYLMFMFTTTTPFKSNKRSF
jgi:hypothetical protein